MTPSQTKLIRHVITKSADGDKTSQLQLRAFLEKVARFGSIKEVLAASTTIIEGFEANESSTTVPAPAGLFNKPSVSRTPSF